MTVVTQVGSVLPLLGSSTGLVFDSFLPAAETAALQAQALAEPGAPSAVELAELTAQIRARGLHHVHGLLMSGVNALSAPLFATGQKLVGVITVVGTAPGFAAEPQGAQAERLLAMAREISARMGGHAPQ
ncbi:putative HTH-type transcriptional regulator RhmR [compost metagenome]